MGQTEIVYLFLPTLPLLYNIPKALHTQQIVHNIIVSHITAELQESVAAILTESYIISQLTCFLLL